MKVSFTVGRCATSSCKREITHCKVGVFGMSQCIFTLWIPASDGQCHLLSPSNTTLHGGPPGYSQKNSRQKAITHSQPSGNFMGLTGEKQAQTFGKQGHMTLSWCLISCGRTNGSMTNMQYIIWHPTPPYLGWHRWAAIMTAWRWHWKWTTENNTPPPHQK